MTMLDDVDPPIDEVRRAVALALAEDIGPIGDLTGSLVPAHAIARASFIARQPGVIAGTSCVRETCQQLDAGLELAVLVEDSGIVEVGSIVARVIGPFRSLLIAERTALNFLCHLSGVATLTRSYVDAANAVNPAARVRDTRKTTPGLRALEKAAVRAGGGINHRASLSGGVLVKDNHLGGVRLADAVVQAIERWPGRFIEVECDDLDQVTQAVEAGAAGVMCDNMSPDDVRRAVEIVQAHPRGRAGAVLVEASGGISLDNIAAYAGAGANLISVGAITHSAPILDIGLDIER
ncbi:MAG TPA: carboxylating nicotinate-nucleotide diphosphorylase [Acidimicrobiales bacterium]|nr:carboxylating nicotinate-nucleotide diphosphorylase [Acidimicrobiales bacterium]